MNVEQMTQWVKDNFDVKDAMEAVCHLGDLRLSDSIFRKPLGLADNVWLKNGEGPFNNCVVYALPFLQDGIAYEARVIVNGQIRCTDSVEMGYVLNAAFKKDLANAASDIKTAMEQDAKLIARRQKSNEEVN